MKIWTPCRLRTTFVAVCVYACASLAGCSLFGGDDFNDLEPGTFRFRAGGDTYTGSAIYEPRTDLEFDQATVFLVSAEGTVMQISTDDFLTAEAGDRFEPLAFFGNSYQRRSGEVEILSVSEGALEGQFRFRMRESGSGPIRGGDVTAEGGFHATLAPE